MSAAHDRWSAAKKRPCRTCIHFRDGLCIAISDDVEPWWTGCIRHELPAAVSQPDCHKVAKWLGDGVTVVESTYGHLLPADDDIDRT